MLGFIKSRLPLSFGWINIFFWITFSLSFIVALLLTFHPSSMESYELSGILKWLVVLVSIVGYTIMTWWGVAMYTGPIVFFIVWLKGKSLREIIGCFLAGVFWGYFVLLMSWGICTLTLKMLLRFYFDIELPGDFEELF